MARTKKADKEKSADKNAAKEPETVEEDQGVSQEVETEDGDQAPAQEPEAEDKDQAAVQEPEAEDKDQAAVQEPEAEDEDQAADQEPKAEDEDQNTTQEPDMFANLPNPCVYCGPSVRGVARQYTTYQGGITDALREFIKEHPSALRLIVPTGKFPAMRKRLETCGTPEAKLYKAVKEEL